MIGLHTRQPLPTSIIALIHEPMRISNSCRRFFIILSILILIVGIAIPLRYESTNRQYIFIRIVHSLLTLKHSLTSDPTRPTLSAEFRAFENLIRIRPVPEYDPLADATTLLKEMRSKSVMSDLIPRPSNCLIINEIFDCDGHTVDTYWIDYSARKFQKRSDQLFIFLHGGGYLIGNIHSHSGVECELSRTFNRTVLHVEYRLSPEHPVPAAVDDTVSLYRTLLRQGISPSRIIFMGDSAGGGLALLTVQTLIARHERIPCGIIVLSPWTDLSASGESFLRNRDVDLLFTHDDVRWVTAQVLSLNQSPHDPRYSPLFGSFQGFPPMYINVGTTEILYDDARRVFQKAQEAGVNVTFEEGLHMMHIYPILASFFPEAQRTLNNIQQWIQTITPERSVE